MPFEWQQLIPRDWPMRVGSSLGGGAWVAWYWIQSRRRVRKRIAAVVTAGRLSQADADAILGDEPAETKQMSPAEKGTIWVFAIGIVVVVFFNSPLFPLVFDFFTKQAPQPRHD